MTGCIKFGETFWQFCDDLFISDVTYVPAWNVKPRDVILLLFSHPMFTVDYERNCTVVNNSGISASIMITITRHIFRYIAHRKFIR